MTATQDCNESIPNPQLNILTDDELCQTFIDHHCAGHPDLARPYMAELINRNEMRKAAEAMYDAARKQHNGEYFALLRRLAKRLMAVTR